MPVAGATARPAAPVCSRSARGIDAPEARREARALQRGTLHPVPVGAEEGSLRGDLRMRTLHLALGAFVLTAAVTLAKVGRDALYFQRGGLYDLPSAYLGMALLSVPLGLLTIALMRRLGPRRARLVVLSGTAGFFLFYAHAAAPGGGALMTVLYMCVPLSIGIAFSMYWLLAADLLEGAPGAELGQSYSVIGACSIAGGLVGGLAARGLARAWEPRALVLLGALAAALCLAIVARAQWRFAPPTTRVRPAERRSLGDVLCVLRDRYNLLLLLSGMATAAAGLLVEFRFYVGAATSGNDARQNATLFATIYLALNGAALAMQLFIAPRLQRVVGVHGSLLVLPTAVVGGAAALLASASSLGPSLLRALEGGLRSSVHRVNWEQAYLTIDGPQRAQTKLIVDGMAGRLAEGAVALVLLAWLRLVIGGRPLAGQDGAWISYLLLAASVAWVGLTGALAAQAGGRSVRRASAALPLPDT